MTRIYFLLFTLTFLSLCVDDIKTLRVNKYNNNFNEKEFNYILDCAQTSSFFFCADHAHETVEFDNEINLLNEEQKKQFETCVSLTATSLSFMLDSKKHCFNKLFTINKE